MIAIINCFLVFRNCCSAPAGSSAWSSMDSLWSCRSVTSKHYRTRLQDFISAWSRACSPSNWSTSSANVQSYRYYYLFFSIIYIAPVRLRMLFKVLNRKKEKQNRKRIDPAHLTQHKVPPSLAIHAITLIHTYTLMEGRLRLSTTQFLVRKAAIGCPKSY